MIDVSFRHVLDSDYQVSTTARSGGVPAPEKRSQRYVVLNARCSLLQPEAMRVGQDTLHGGVYGWDRRNWTIVSRTPSSVTYHHLDAADEGFPGNVSAFVRSATAVACVAQRLNVSLCRRHTVWRTAC